MKNAFFLEIPSVELRKDLFEHYQGKVKQEELKIDAANSAIELANSEIEKYKNLLNQLKTSLPSDSSSYNENWGWGLKMKFILSHVGHCLTSREIANELLKYNSGIKNPMNSISSIIIEKVKKGILFDRYEIENTKNPSQPTYYYGLIEWFKNKGQLVDEKYRGKE